MFAYWALFGIFGVAAATTDERKRRLGIISWLIAGILLIVMIGLRRNVGADWRAYQAIFDRLSYLGFSGVVDTVDPSYKLLNLLAASLGFGVWAVNLACAIIFTIGLLRFCRDQPNPVLAVLVGIPYLVIVVAMGYTRQGAALGLELLALVYYFRGSLVRMAICLALAVTFHKSAIIVIPLIAISASRRGFHTFLLLVATSVLMYWLFVSTSLDRFVANYIGARYNSSGAGVRIAMNVVPATLYLLFRGRFSQIRDEQRLWTVFALGSFVALGLLFATPSSTAVDRMALYLIPLQLFVLSRVPVAFSGGESPSIAAKFAVIAYSMAVQFIWLNYADNARAWIPYDNYLMDLRG
jgi:hypothetical protein